jgi:hypothetical protein
MSDINTVELRQLVAICNMVRELIRAQAPRH